MASSAKGKGKPDYIDADKVGNKKEPMKKAINDKKMVKEERTTISNFINCLLEGKYKESHKYLEQIIHHKLINKMSANQSDKLF